MSVWNDKMAEHQEASRQVSVNSAFTWSLRLCNVYQFWFSNMWVLQHHACLGYEHHYSFFVYLGLQFKWNRFSSNNFHHTSLTLIPAWINNYIHYKVWDEITYPFLNFNGAIVDVWEWISNFIPHYTWHVITYPCWDQSESLLVKGAPNAVSTLG